jgi:magnesium transporter
MSRFLKKRKKTKGLPPGSLVRVGSHAEAPLEITLVEYTKEKITEKKIAGLNECIRSAGNEQIMTWIDVTGLADKAIMKEIGEKFGIHSLWLEDVLNTDHRPKVEELDNLVFIIIKIPSLSENHRHVSFEQVSVFLGKTFVISFQEHLSDTFSSLKERMHKGTGGVRGAKADYLFYALIDRVVDDYYDVVESLGVHVDQLETALRADFKNFNPDDIILLRNEFLYLRKAAVPIRDALKTILASKVSEIDPANKRYFRDAYDHALHIVEAIDGYRELLKGQVDSYQNTLNQKMTEVMKVLTVFASIFTPLTFIAGVYGMNFRHMPELSWDYGYYFSLGLMLVVASCLLYYFRRKGWL